MYIVQITTVIGMITSTFTCLLLHLPIAVNVGDRTHDSMIRRKWVWSTAYTDDCLQTWSRSILGKCDRLIPFSFETVALHLHEWHKCVLLTDAQQDITVHALPFTLGFDNFRLGYGSEELLNGLSCISLFSSRWHINLCRRTYIAALTLAYSETYFLLCCSAVQVALPACDCERLIGYFHPLTLGYIFPCEALWLALWPGVAHTCRGLL